MRLNFAALGHAAAPAAPRRMQPVCVNPVRYHMIIITIIITLRCDFMGWFQPFLGILGAAIAAASHQTGCNRHCPRNKRTACIPELQACSSRTHAVRSFAARRLQPGVCSPLRSSAQPPVKKPGRPARTQSRSFAFKGGGPRSKIVLRHLN